MQNKILYILDNISLLIFMFLGIAIISFLLGIYVSYHGIIHNIEIDGINEVRKNIITLKINDKYYDYEYIGGRKI